MKVQTRIFNRQFIALFLCLFCACYGMYCLNAVFPLYIGALGGSAGDVGVMSACYTVTACLFRILSGNRSAVIGRKKLILLGGMVLAAGVAGLALVQKYILFIFFRGVQGAGYAMMTVGASTAVIDVLPPERLGEGLGISLLASSIALSISPAIGLLISRLWGMRAAILSTVLMAGVGMGIVALFCDYENSATAEDPAEKGQDPPTKKLSVWDYIERTALLPAGIYLMHLAGYAVSYTYMTLIAENEGVPNPGSYFTAASAAQVIARILAGWIADQRGNRGILLLGGIVSISAYTVLIPALSPGRYVLAGVLFGMGIGIIGPVLNKRSVEFAAPEHRGAASATFFVAGDLGVGLGGLLWGAVLDHAHTPLVFALTALWMALATAASFIGGGKQNERIGRWS